MSERKDDQPSDAIGKMSQEDLIRLDKQLDARLSHLRDQREAVERDADIQFALRYVAEAANQIKEAIPDATAKTIVAALSIHYDLCDIERLVESCGEDLATKIIAVRDVRRDARSEAWKSIQKDRQD